MYLRSWWLLKIAFARILVTDGSQVNIPKDHVANTHRGFGFVEFEVEEDAKAAVENMDGENMRVITSLLPPWMHTSMTVRRQRPMGFHVRRRREISSGHNT